MGAPAMTAMTAKPLASCPDHDMTVPHNNMNSNFHLIGKWTMYLYDHRRISAHARSTMIATNARSTNSP